MLGALQLVFAGGIYIPPEILDRDEPSDLRRRSRNRLPRIAARSRKPNLA